MKISEIQSDNLYDIAGQVEEMREQTHQALEDNSISVADLLVPFQDLNDIFPIRPVSEEDTIETVLFEQLNIYEVKLKSEVD